MTYAWDNDDPHRISAVNPMGIEIAGAEEIGDDKDDMWRLYLTTLTDHHLRRHYPVVHLREGALEWVEAVAELYSITQELKDQLAQRGKRP